MRKRIPTGARPDTPEHETHPSAPRGTSRRDFLKSSAVGIVATAVASQTVAYADGGAGGAAHPAKHSLIVMQETGGPGLNAPERERGCPMFRGMKRRALRPFFLLQRHSTKSTGISAVPLPE